jgi:type IV secretory pathway protease TraF
LPWATALDRDRRGPPAARLAGLPVIADGELFLMNWQSATASTAAISARSRPAAVIGRATPLYTDEDGDGRFVWRAPTR